MKKEKDFYQVSLKIFLKNDKGEILALKAVEDSTFAGSYDLPGGRINTDEFKIDFAEILKREVEEEIGKVNFHINSNKPVAFGRHLIPAARADSGRETHVLYLFFEAEFLDGDITISNEHTDYKWLDLKGIDPKQYFKSGILEGVRMYCGG
jgi:8-oxo-dGTP pyrophosphatase MutT (NUDIX family)